MKPNPRDFRNLTSYQAAVARYHQARLAAESAQRRRKEAKLMAAAFLTAGLILALINWPAYFLKGLAMLAGAAIGAALWWLNECRIEAKEYNEEHYR